ncbi:MAG: metallopeptidase TldD-related protein [Terracidiphilus sp.]|jgi:predicted Zn-dependent protease
MNLLRSLFSSRFAQFVILSGAHPSRSEGRAQPKDLRLLFGRARRPLLTRFLLVALLLVPALFSADVAPAQPTRADAEKDPVLKAMLAELDRSMSQLDLPGFAKPFFIQYRIEQVDNFETRAEFGAGEGSGRVRQRVARVTVRVGDYKTDSSGGRGDGSIELAGLDDDPIAIRCALWQATDQAYKSALDAYAQKQAALKQVQTPPQADDFSHEKPIVSLASPIALVVDESAWTSRVARLSGLYRTDPTVSAAQHDVEYSEGSFRARSTTTWLVTSEGTIVRKSAAQYEETFAAGAQAADGMSIDRSYGSTGTSTADLDSEAAFNKHAVDEIASLAELRKAPLVEEEYHGPLLMSADAATDVLRSLLAASISATRSDLGTEARTNGPFASSYHARVLPDFMNVVDDPSLKTYEGKGLVGAYDVDDEGVPAQAVKLVDAGRLDNYIIGRQPVRDFPQSNGHGRAGVAGPAHPSIGVLKISAQNGLGEAELNQKLLAIAKDRGLTNVYVVETMGSSRTPRLLYRVSLDGKRELVRGAVLDDIDERALRSSIETAGKDLFIANYYGDVPTTVMAPALLFDDATVTRANAKNEKLPFYPPPE